jgi:prophage antirepressor-like protein
MSPAKYEFEGVAVRVLEQDQQPWFVLSDVANVLGIANARDAAMRVPEDEKGVATADTLGGPQKLTIISEPGLYRMIFQSRKPSAERFKSWVVREVLPAIRKTGRYATGTAGTGSAEEWRGLMLEAARGVMAGTVEIDRARVLAALASGWAQLGGRRVVDAAGAAVRGLVEESRAAVADEEAEEMHQLAEHGIAEKLRRNGVRPLGGRLNGKPLGGFGYHITLREMVKVARAAGWEGRCLGELTGRAAETRLGALCRRHWEGHEMTLGGHVWLCRKHPSERQSQWSWILQEEGADG